MENELIKHLNELKKGVVIRSRAGGGAGSIILMDIENTSGTLYELWIECTWRIENQNNVIATSADDIEAITGLIAKSTKSLEKRVVNFIEINSFYDLCIHFSDNLCLRIFCIFSSGDEYDINWRLSIPSKNLSYEVTNLFKIKKRSYGK